MRSKMATPARRTLGAVQLLWDGARRIVQSACHKAETPPFVRATAVNARRYPNWYNFISRDCHGSTPEITFHNMRSSQTLRTEILKRIAKLEKFYGRLISAGSIEARTKQHRTGNVYDVHIEMQAPGGHLVVAASRTISRNGTPIPMCVPPFTMHSRPPKRSCGPSERNNMARLNPRGACSGQIAELFADRDFGFIQTHEGARLYFHRNSLMNGDFEKLKRDDAVQFVEGAGDTGPAAVKVWLARAMTPTH